MPYHRGNGVNVLIHNGTSPPHEGLLPIVVATPMAAAAVPGKSGFQSQVHSSRPQPVDGVNALEQLPFQRETRTCSCSLSSTFSNGQRHRPYFGRIFLSHGVNSLVALAGIATCGAFQSQ